MPDFDKVLANSKDGRYWGKYQAIVSDNNDPENKGRIRVKQNFFYGVDSSPWAMPCVPFGGSPQIGVYDAPEIGSGVWIEFQYGIPKLPIWTGFWFARPNGNSELPNEAHGKPYMRLKKTKHFIISSDDSEGILRIKKLDDDSGLEINGQEIIINKGSCKITILNDQILIEGDDIKINGGSIQLESQGSLNLVGNGTLNLVGPVVNTYSDGGSSSPYSAW